MDNREYISEAVLKSGSEFLSHHGVLGMKWGIRKDGKPQGWQGGTSNKKVGSNIKEQKQGMKDLAKAIKSNRHTIITTPRKIPSDFGTGHPELAKIGSKIMFEDKTKRDSKIKKIDDRIEKLKAGPKTDNLKYLKDYKSALDEKDKIYREYVNKSIDELNTVKNKNLIEKEDKQFKKFTKRKLINEYIDWSDFYGDEIERVESKIDRLETKAMMEHSRKDLMEMNDNEDHIVHSIDVGDEFLMHYGVKGMKWRHRKQQNNIGSAVLKGMGYRAPTDAGSHGLARLHYTLNTKHGEKGKRVSKAISNEYQKGVRKRQRKSLARSRITLARGTNTMTKLLGKSISSTVKHSEIQEDILSHHGVLGMHWGIRKDGKPQGWQGNSSKALNNAKNINSQQQRLQQTFNPHSEKMLNMLVDLDNNEKKFFAIQEKAMAKFEKSKSLDEKKKILNDLLIKEDDHVQAQYDRIMKLDRDKDLDKHDRKIKEKSKDIVLKKHRDYEEAIDKWKQSKISEITKSKHDEHADNELAELEALEWYEDMSHSIDVGNEFLMHYGVLGMHWGIRKDGKPQGWQGDGRGRTAVNAAKTVGKGVKRVAKGSASAAVKGRAKIKQINAARNERKQLESARNNELALEDKKRQQAYSYKIASTTRSARALSKHMGSLSDKELNDRLVRLSKENAIREMAAKERERNRSWLSKAVENSAKTSFSNVATYGMTKLGKQAVDGLFERALGTTNASDSSGGNKAAKSSISSFVETYSKSDKGPINITDSSTIGSTSNGSSSRYSYSRYNDRYSSRGSARSKRNIAPGGSKSSNYKITPSESQPKLSSYKISPSSSKSGGLTFSPSGSSSNGYKISPTASTAEKGTDFIFNYIIPDEYK